MCINILYLIRNYSYYIVPTSNGYTKNNNFIYSFLPRSMNYASCMNSCSTFPTNRNQPITIYLNGVMTKYPSMTTWISVSTKIQVWSVTAGSS